MPTRVHTLVSLSTFRADARAASKLPGALRELPYSPSVTWSSRSGSFTATETNLAVTPTMVFTKYTSPLNKSENVVIWSEFRACLSKSEPIQPKLREHQRGR